MKRRSPPKPPEIHHEFATMAESPTVAAVVRQQTGFAWSRARRLCEEGRVTLDGERCVDPAKRVPAGGVVAVDAHAPKLQTGLLPASAIVHYDHDVVVVDKPVGVLSVADEPGNKETLVDATRTLLRRVDPRSVDGKLGVVHRLDRDTSGLMVFARNATAQRALAADFRRHAIERVYHGIAHGSVPARRIESLLILDRGDGLRGSFGVFRRAAGPAPREARPSITFVAPLENLAGATLIECRLETGRQHQIRIHLSELGHPLLGERVYIRDYTGPVIAAPRTMLHARVLGFVHPRSGATVRFEREAPEDFLALLTALRR